MTFKIMDGATLRTITKLSVKDGGVVRQIRTLKVKDAGGTLRTVATFISPLSVSLNFTSRTAKDTDGDGVATTTADSIATPSGGFAPFSYSWTRLTGVGSATAPTSGTTRFTASGLAADTSYPSTFRLTVTDSAAQTATADVSINFIGLFSGGAPGGP